MRFSFKNKRILVIDRQKYWRELVADTLAETDYQVTLLDDYNYDTEAAYFTDGKTPDLVIMGCVRIGPEERELIHRILEDGLHLMVFSSLLPAAEMRDLFREGAEDVADKTYDQERLVTAVEEVFNAREGDSYQRAGEKRLL
jgi:DNA-binding NtrC family response regulator